MKTIILASENPVKIRATMDGFQRMFPDEVFETRTVSVSSDVGVQPLSDGQTLQGALNRARNAALHTQEAAYWVGIEGGVQDEGGEMVAFAWIVVLSHALVGKSRTGSFVLPNEVADLVRRGKELGTADDIVFSKVDSKQGSGAVGILTRDVIGRKGLYEHAVILALIPFKNAALYSIPPECTVCSPAAGVEDPLGATRTTSQR